MRTVTKVVCATRFTFHHICRNTSFQYRILVLFLHLALRSAQVKYIFKRSHLVRLEIIPNRNVGIQVSLTMLASVLKQLRPGVDLDHSGQEFAQ